MRTKIQENADKLILSASAISKEILNYQNDCKNKGVNIGKDIIESKFQQIANILPEIGKYKNNLILANGFCRTSDLHKQIIATAYAASAMDNYISDDEDIDIQIPVKYISTTDEGSQEFYQEQSVVSYDEDGELVDSANSPSILVPKAISIDLSKFKDDINYLVNQKILSAKKSIDEKLDGSLPKENLGESQNNTSDIRFEAAKMLSDMLKNNGQISVKSEATGEVINLDLTQSIKFNGAKERYSLLADDLYEELLKSNGVVKISTPREVIARLPNGETIKRTELAYQYGSQGYTMSDFFSTLLTNQDVKDSENKSVSLMERYTQIAKKGFQSKIDKWIEENKAYQDNSENNAKLFDFFMDTMGDAQKQIHATYFPKVDAKALTFDMIDNPFKSSASHVEAPPQFNTAHSSYSGGNQIAENSINPTLQLSDNPPVGAAEIHHTNYQAPQNNANQPSLSQGELAELLI